MRMIASTVTIQRKMFSRQKMEMEMEYFPIEWCISLALERAPLVIHVLSLLKST